MRNSLLFKLMGAFLLVIAAGALFFSIFTSQATRSAFTIYTTRSGQAIAAQLAPTLAEYYGQAQSWRGVDALLPTLAQTTGGMGRMGHGGQNGNNGSMMAGAGQRLIVAGADGQVVGDTQGELTGKTLSASQAQSGADIQWNGVSVGTVLVSPAGMSAAGGPGAEFLASVDRAILLSTIIAALIALGAGGLLFLNIIAPLRRLKLAASAIAQGDLTQRVDQRSKDEFGELGHAFNQMAASLADSEARRQRLMADVAHELRTPLTAIQGTLEGIQDGVLPLNQEQVTILHAETLLLGRLVNDLRLLSLAEAGQLKLERQRVAPEPCLRQAVERAQPQAQQKQIELSLEMEPNLPPVLMDSDRVAQVLHNLIGNALRHTPPGGRILARARLSGGALEISVADSGEGIAPEDLPHIFDRFYRADRSRARVSGGSGLGLAIVKYLVEAHGGQVRAESPANLPGAAGGPGARVRFTLPLE